MGGTPWKNALSMLHCTVVHCTVVLVCREGNVVEFVAESNADSSKMGAMSNESMHVCGTVKRNRTHIFISPNCAASSPLVSRVARAWRIPFIPTSPMTACRPDLASDVTGMHYSRHLSLAVLDVLLAGWCPPQGGGEALRSDDSDC